MIELACPDTRAHAVSLFSTMTLFQDNSASEVETAFTKARLTDEHSAKTEGHHRRIEAWQERMSEVHKKGFHLEIPRDAAVELIASQLIPLTWILKDGIRLSHFTLNVPPNTISIQDHGRGTACISFRHPDRFVQMEIYESTHYGTFAFLQRCIENLGTHVPRVCALEN
jgi:hypothetical protein